MRDALRGRAKCAQGISDQSVAAPTQPIELGTVDIKEGANILAMDIAGTEKGGYLVGLDYIKLAPVP